MPDETPDTSNNSNPITLPDDLNRPGESGGWVWWLSRLA
jgi:hypothetical protein